MKTGAPGVSAFGGVWIGDGAGGGEGGFGFTSGLDCGPPIGGLGKGRGAKSALSFMGRLGGIDPPDDGGVWRLVGGTLICGLIGLDELDASEGFVGSAMFTQRDTSTRIVHELHE